MKSANCERENEVLEAVRSGRWPEFCDAELRAHMEGCDVCAEVALVAGFMERVGEAPGIEKQLPSAGLIWWKTQLRARREAQRRALEPIAMAERFACACAVLCALAVAIWQWPRLETWFGQWADFWHIDHYWMAHLAASLWNQTSGAMFVVVAGACLLFITLVAYALSAEE